MSIETNKRVFDIIIPTYNNRNELSKCLDSLDKQTFRSFYVYICVDGSTDDTLTWLTYQSYSFDFEVLEHADHSNHGRAAARNLGLRKLIAEYVIMLDSDVAALPNLLEAHLDFLRKWGDISVGDIHYSNANKNQWAHYLQQRGKHRFQHEALIPASYFVTQNVALNSSIIKKAGLMDEAIKGYGGDDLDWGIRLVRETGKKCRYNKKALVHSKMNKDLVEALYQMQEFGGHGLPYLLEKNKDYSEIPNIFGIHLRERKSIYSPVWHQLSRLFLHFPFFIAKYAIHYLVFYNVATGYIKYHGTKNSSE